MTIADGCSIFCGSARAAFYANELREFSALSEPAIELSPEEFINRDLSWLWFNRRVLHEAEDERTPLLDRVRFYNIFNSNLDEFS
jgi:polyphosphate kinase